MQQPLESTILPCQKIRSFARGKKELVVSSSFSVEKETLVYPNLPESNENLNFVLSCIRSDSFSASDDIPTPTWAGCRSLLSTQTSPVVQVGFLPYLPYPVTKHETVFIVQCIIFLVF